MSLPDSIQSVPGPARRTVAKGAAWSVPAVAIAAAAPAMALSVTCADPCPTALFTGPGSNNVGTAYPSQTQGCAPLGLNANSGWYWGSDRALSTMCNPPTNMTGFVRVASNSMSSPMTCTPNSRGVTQTLIDGHPVVYTEDDPTSGKMTYALQRKLCLTGGKTYTFCFRYMLRRVNCRPLELVPALFDATNTTNLTSTWQTVFQGPCAGALNITSQGDIASGTNVVTTAGGTPINFTLYNGGISQTGFYPGAFYYCSGQMVGSYCQTYTPATSVDVVLRLMWYWSAQGTGALTGGDGAWAEPVITCA